MTTSSLKLAAPPRDYQCPPWCERTDHDADEVGPANPLMHYGPEFGHVGTLQSGDDADSLAALVGVRYTDDALDAAELRRLAADALAAAEWLEDY